VDKPFHETTGIFQASRILSPILAVIGSAARLENPSKPPRKLIREQFESAVVFESRTVLTIGGKFLHDFNLRRFRQVSCGRERGSMPCIQEPVLMIYAGRLVFFAALKAEDG
jgi:hypothetical protein